MKHFLSRLIGIVCLLSYTGLSYGYDVIDVSEGGALSGMVTLEGSLLLPRPIT